MFKVVENNIVNGNLSLIVTEDGSHSLQLSSIPESYHSCHGALNEAIHVYLKPNFIQQAKTVKTIYVFEMGFGTGLNAFLTFLYAYILKCRVVYTTIEAFPISRSIYNTLNYPTLCIEQLQLEYPSINLLDFTDIFFNMHISEWEKEIPLSKSFTLIKHAQHIQNFSFPENQFDVVYYDAFAPQFQPDLWTPCIFQKLHRSMSPNGILTTYCCKGDVKRALKISAFRIEKLQGPKGKREILRAFPIF